MKFRLFKIICLAVIAMNLVKAYNFAETVYSSALTKSVVEIILNYFNNVTDVIYILRSSNIHIENSQLAQLDIINDILYNTNSQIMVELESINSMQKVKSYPSFHNLFFVDSFQSFHKIFLKMTDTRFDFTGYYLVILTYDSRQQYRIIRNILQHFWQLHIVNVNVIMNTLGNNWEAIMYTYEPYTRYHCGKVFPVILSYFRHNSFLKNTDYFPRKLTNFHKCKLYVAAFDCPPFLTYQELENGTYMVDGIEGTLLRVLSQRLNFAFDLIIPEARWGMVADNGTATGAVKLVLESAANFTIGYFQINENRNKFMSSSLSYLTSHLLFVVPPGKEYTPIEKLLLPFKPYIWISLTFIFSFSIIVILFLRCCASLQQRNFIIGRNMQEPVLNFINIVFGNSLHVLPYRNFARTLIIIWILACLVFRTIYQGSLFYFMQDNTNKTSVLYLEEMVNRDYILHMTANIEPFFKNNPKAYRNIRTFSDFKVRDSIVANIINNSSANEVVVDGAEFIAWFNKVNYHKSFKLSGKENIITTQLAIYFTKSSPLTWRMNEEILQLTSNGLIMSWVKKHVDWRYMKPPKHSGEPAKITLYELLGGFQLLSLGYILSSMVFIFELLQSRFNWFQ